MVQKLIGKELMSRRINQIEPLIDSKDVNAVKDYLNSGGWLTEHKETQLFENNIKKYVQRNYSIAVPNGTIALYLSLKALGIGKGDKVAVPNLTMIATINSVLWADATPVLVDVDEYLCMSFENLQRIRGLKAVIFVPLNGRVGDGEKIEKWCKNHNIFLIEDSAHALGSSYNKTKKCGSLGDISIFSFTPHKIITMGQGGMILTNKKSIAEKIVRMKTFNRLKDKSDFHAGFGLNFKITDLQASIGNSQFYKIENHISKKLDLMKNYLEFLPKEIKIVEFSSFEVPWFIEIIFKSKNQKLKAISKLSKQNIETRLAYPPLSKQNYLKKYSNNRLSYSEFIFDKILWMPSSLNLSKKDIRNICSFLI